MRKSDVAPLLHACLVPALGHPHVHAMLPPPAPRAPVWTGIGHLISEAERAIGDLKAYLQEGMTVILSVHEGVAIAIDLPRHVTLEITETEPVVKGQTASSSYKPAILSNGVRSPVPPHIGVGTRIVVMTADGSYVERAKD